MTVVVHPAPDAGVVSPCQLVQADGGLSREMPLANHLPDPLLCRCTDRRQETRPALPVAFRGASWPELVPQERKADPGIFLPAVAVFAVDDAGFVRMHLQFAFLQPLVDGLQ